MKKLFTLFLLCSTAFLANANKYTVRSTGDAGPDTFRQAVLDANAHTGQDTIVFEVYINTRPISLTSGVVNITDNTVIIGNDTSNTIISHDDGGSVGIDITGGTFFKLTDCKINAGTSSNGTLSFSSASTNAEVINCLFEGNNLSVQFIKLDPVSALSVRSSTFLNSANSGIYSHNNELNVTGCTFDNCKVALSDISGKIENTTISNSSAIAIYNTIITPALILRNNTITNSNVGIKQFGGSVTMENNIIFGNTLDVDLSSDFYLIQITNERNIVGTCKPGDVNSTPCPSWYSSEDPLLDPTGLQNNGGYTKTIALLAGSPAINTANTNAPTKDQRGYSRNGLPDIGAFEFNACPSITSTDTQTACGSFTWIDGKTYTESNNTAKDTLQTAIGCDSIVTLNLSITELDLGLTISNDTTITANQSGATYQWYDCDLQEIIANETNQSINAKWAGSYALIITNGSCTDTTDCIYIDECAFNWVTIIQSGTTLTASSNISPASYDWMNCADSSTIEGEQNSMFTPTANGSYAVFVNGELCGKMSDCFVVTNIGIDEQNNVAFSLYPNPSNTGIFTLDFEGAIQELTVIDMLGRVMPVTVTNKTVDASNLSYGHYIVSIKTIENILLQGIIDIR